MLVQAKDATVHETPNASMHTLAAPSVGSTELATWIVEMEPGSSGPMHSTDHEQVWVVLEGALVATLEDGSDEASVGDSVILPAGTDRQISTEEGLRAIVSTVAKANVRTEAQGTQPLPWAA